MDVNGCGVDTSAWTWDGSVRDGDGVCQAPAVSTPAPPPPPAPSAVSGIEVTPLDGALHVDWRPASGQVSQYRIRVMRETAEGLEVVRQLYTEAAVTELRVENLSNGVTYAVTVAALNGRGAGSEGPTSEPVRGSPAGGPDPDPPPDPDPDPVPALPFAGSAALALAAQFEIAGQRLKTIGFDRALDEAIAAAGGEVEIAASLAADPDLGFTQEEALAAVRELLESDMSEIYMDLSEAFRAAARGVDP